MRILLDLSTIKAQKRNDLRNPITAVFHNIHNGLSESNYGCDLSTNFNDHNCVFVFGSITRRKPDTERAIAIQSHRDRGTPIFSLDSGLFSTYIRRRTNSSESNFFRVGLGDCVGDANFLNENSGNKRYEWFKQAYDFSEQPPTKNLDGDILFILQTERGWQYDNLEPYKDWARKTLKRLRGITDRHIILRAHPNHAREPLEYIAEGVSNVSFQYGERARQSSIDVIRKVSCVVTHSSSAAMEAYIEGVPVFALDKRCLGYKHFNQSIHQINHLKDYNWDERYQNLCNWAYTTWHIEEFKNPKLVEYYIKRAKI